MSQAQLGWAWAILQRIGKNIDLQGARFDQSQRWLSTKYWTEHWIHVWNFYFFDIKCEKTCSPFLTPHNHQPFCVDCKISKVYWYFVTKCILFQNFVFVCVYEKLPSILWRLFCEWPFKAFSPQGQWGAESFSSPEQLLPQAEANTLLHESPNSEPETIEQCEIVFHYIGVWVAWMRVVPLIRAKPTGEREKRHTSQYKEHRTLNSLMQINEKIIHWSSGNKGLAKVFFFFILENRVPAQRKKNHSCFHWNQQIGIIKCHRILMEQIIMLK